MEELVLKQSVSQGVGEDKVLKKPRRRKNPTIKERICKGVGCGKLTTTCWALCDDCREKARTYIPTPEEIAAQCAIIRSENNRQVVEGTPSRVPRMPKVYSLRIGGLRCRD